VRDPALTIALLEFELHIKPTNYKFGVVLAPSGRTKVDEMLQVENATPAFNAFLNILGERIALRGWSGYRGDLDISSNCRTGERSVYAELDECQIMYHVSTMLPSDPHDAQQTARRMYLLSDIVVVVFLEGGHFSPHEFAAMSKQIHVILVVEPVVTGRDDELPAVGVRATRRARVWPADSAQLFLSARRLLSRFSAHENGQCGACGRCRRRSLRAMCSARDAAS
jgi:signal-induced proliferation-associated 1 like protein 1